MFLAVASVLALKGIFSIEADVVVGLCTTT